MRDVNRPFYNFALQFIAGSLDQLEFDSEEKLFDIVFEEFSSEELRELREFMNRIVAEWSDEELDKFWNSGPSDLFITPLRPFLERCIAYIDTHELPADKTGN
jgi:hypothetical protein